jgi:SAM-dependent methyltransferase
LIEPIYFYQDTWAFERILLKKPYQHVDIGSHHKFVAFLSKITNLSMVDIRPLSLEMASINFIKGDILHLPYENETVDSLSSLCVIEHIGLGRYGDEIDPSGSEKAFNEINRILRVGANFYMSVPIEEINKVYFNAHRAFNEEYLLKTLLYNYQVEDRKYIYSTKFSDQKASGFGVGCYHLIKTN